MENNTTNIETTKRLYQEKWQEYQKIESTYHEWKKKHDDALAALTGLRQFLLYSGVDIEELERSLKSTISIGESVEGKTLPDLIYEVLEATAHPMHYGEILDALVRRGYSVAGKDPRNTVLAYISRHKKRFTKAPEKGKGYYKLLE
jgi:hypothetical protein